MKIGFVSMPLSGHLNPMTALARRLQSHGNDAVLFGVPDVEPFARAAGLDFVPDGEAEYPLGSIDKVYGSVATMRGFEVVRYSCMDLNPEPHPSRLRLPGRKISNDRPNQLPVRQLQIVYICGLHFAFQTLEGQKRREFRGFSSENSVDQIKRVGFV